MMRLSSAFYAATVQSCIHTDVCSGDYRHTGSAKTISRGILRRIIYKARCHGNVTKDDLFTTETFYCICVTYPQSRPGRLWYIHTQLKLLHTRTASRVVHNNPFVQKRAQNTGILRKTHSNEKIAIFNGISRKTTDFAESAVYFADVSCPPNRFRVKDD